MQVKSGRIVGRDESYADYGAGRELRQLVDQLSEASDRIVRWNEEAEAIRRELDQIGSVLAALASEMRRNG